MVSLRTVGMEVASLGAAALSMPLRFMLPDDGFDASSPHPTPVVLVHGFLGDPGNFLLLRAYLARRGVTNFSGFSYGLRLDYPRLAPRLGEMIERVCAITDAEHVDVVGHSLGGLVARYLLETGTCNRIRRLITLGSPYFASPTPPYELAIFAASDPFIPAPDPYFVARAAGQVEVIPQCGHWGLLFHPAVLRRVAHFLCDGVPRVHAATPFPRSLAAGY
jgi:pimeloyl-ACP methyl ester carboxylesterase